MDEFDFFMLFRWFRRLVAVALCLGLWFMPKPTEAIILSAIDAKSKQLTNEYIKLLAPTFSSAQKGRHESGD